MGLIETLADSAESNMRKVFQPFKIRNRHTARIGENIRNHQNPIVIEFRNGPASDWAVGCFNNCWSFYIRGIVFINHSLNGCRNKYIHIQGQELFIC